MFAEDLVARILITVEFLMNEKEREHLRGLAIRKWSSKVWHSHKMEYQSGAKNYIVTFRLTWKGVHYTFSEKSKLEMSINFLLNMVDWHKFIFLPETTKMTIR